MLYLGCHLSSTGGFEKMVDTAVSIGANTFQFFTRNPRGSRAKAPDPEDAARAMAKMRELSFGPVVAHGSYTMNLCTKEPEARAFAAQVLKEDLDRLRLLPGALYNFHPGSHVGQGTEAGCAMIAEALNGAMAPDLPVTVLLETMAGKGSEIGGTFGELRQILDRVELSEKMGVCLDTCHVFDGGYDIVDRLDQVLEEFDRVLGLGRLRALHINDSKNPLGSRKDRHERIGQGFLGTQAILRIVDHPALCGLPMILETPNDLPGYAGEIRLLRREKY